jgi:hypothetical protein
VSEIESVVVEERAMRRGEEEEEDDHTDKSGSSSRPIIPGSPSPFLKERGKSDSGPGEPGRVGLFSSSPKKTEEVEGLLLLLWVWFW